MCARITITTTVSEIADLFGLTHDLRQSGPAPKARYNVAPSMFVPVVRLTDGARTVTDLKWGLIPHWNTERKPLGYANARAESALSKPAFRDPFRHRRCLVPATGFFEWKTIGKAKRPYYIRPVGGGLFSCAGVWDRWESPDGPVDTVALLTVPANDLIKPLHERMPAIVPPDHFTAWLDPKESRPAKVLPLLAPYPIERMEMWPVSDRVNTVAADDPELLVAIEEPPPPWTQPTLFDVA
jgi:putative SOS response-associated peptidase YedK